MNRWSGASATLACVILLLSLLPASALAAAPAGNAVIGDYVWLDANADGFFAGAENQWSAGIEDVRVNLYLDSNNNGLIDPGEFVEFATTADNPNTGVVDSGYYRFTVTAGNQYIVQIDPSNFAAGGPLEGKVLTSGATIGPNPLVVPPITLGQDYLDADFGYINAPISITKARFNTDLYVASGASVVFRITIANTGPQTLSPVPLDDFFNPACLKYVSASITPDVVDAALGRLHWNNLGSLPTGQSFTVDVTFTAQTTTEMAWKEGGWQDYAPKGIPDFDEKQAGWDNPLKSGSGWYRAGPVAMANSLWWFDSKFEPGNTPPPTISDGYGLIKTYSTAIPPEWDDHDPRNVPPLVDDLATRMSATAGAGTTPADLAAGVTSFISDAGLAAQYTVTTQKTPTFAWVNDEVRRSEDVILLVGFWQVPVTGGTAKRLGGTYVTSSGVDLLNSKIAVTDPYKNSAEAGGAGRVLPGAHAAKHPASGPQTAHNDAQYISEDAYAIVATTGVSAGVWGPDAYINSAPATGCSQVAPFAGQNVPTEYAGNGGTCETAGGPIITTVEYAVAVSPVQNTLICSPTVNIAAATGVKVPGANNTELPPAQSETIVTQGMDLGDLPDPIYPTLIATDGARHLITSPLVLGTKIDAELNGQPTSGVNGDDNNGSVPDDEEGVTYQPGLSAGVWTNGLVSDDKGGHIQIVISGGRGVPQLFMDFNTADATPGGPVTLRDNTGAPLSTTAWPAGTYQVYFDIPAGTMGGNPTNIPTRMRLSSAGGLSLTGLSTDGEVEDYLFSFGPNAVSVLRLTAQPVRMPAGASALTYALVALGLVAAGVGARRLLR